MKRSGNSKSQGTIRHFLIFLLFTSPNVFAQLVCPEITSSSLQPESTGYCQGDVITLTIEGNNLYAACSGVNWYLSPNPGNDFWNNESAEYLGYSPISITPGACVPPELLYAMIDPDDGLVGSADDCEDEFIVLYFGGPNEVWNCYSGNAGGPPDGIFLNDIDICFDQLSSSEHCSPEMFYSGPYVPGNASTFNCGESIDPSYPIPENCIVIIQSSTTNNVPVDLGDLCNSGLPIYIIAMNATNCQEGFLANNIDECSSCSLVFSPNWCTHCYVSGYSWWGGGSDDGYSSDYEPCTSTGYDPPTNSTSGWGFSNALGGGVYSNTVPEVNLPNPYSGTEAEAIPFTWMIPYDFCLSHPAGTYYIQGLLGNEILPDCPWSTTDIFEIYISCFQVDAGEDQTICEGGPISIEGSASGPTGLLEWTTSGDGSFGNPFLIQTTYFPGPEDINNGYAVLTLSASDASGSCGTAIDYLTVNIFEGLEADAGVDITTCNEDDVQLNGTVSGGNVNIEWTTSGDGAFENPDQSETTYTPGQSDINAGIVILTLHVFDPSGTCDPAFSETQLTILQLQVEAGPDQVICFDDDVILNGTSIGASSFVWSTSGDGTFGNPSSEQTTYNPDANDANNGVVILTLTAIESSGTCDPVSSSLQITLNSINYTLNLPASVCENSYPLPLSTIQNGITGNWSGPGVFTNTFDPSGLSGDVSITFTPYVGQCAIAASHIITINEIIIPVISGIPSSLCENEDAIVLSIIQNGITGQWSGPGISNNTFNPDNFNGPVLFVFTPDENQCAGNTTFEIIVEPVIVPEIIGVPSEMCGADFPVVLNTNQNGITGNWSGPGVMNNVFDPEGLNGTIIVTFIPDNPCAITVTADIIVLSTLVPLISGIPSTICQIDDPFPLPEMLLQITGDWSGSGVSNNMFNPNGQNGNIILTFTPEIGQCAINVTTSIVVTTTMIPIITGVPFMLCQTDPALLLPEVISGITGNWSGQNVIANVFTPEGLNGNYTLQFSPDDGQCAQGALTEITIHTSPTFINLNADCDSTSHTYTVSFDIIEGDPSSYTVNGVPVGGTHFISPPISSGNTEYLFTLNDVNGCGQVQIQGNLDCTCATFAGTMNFPGAPVKICEGSEFSVAFNGDSKLDPDDVLGFVLHDQAGTQLGNVYAISSSPAFTYPSGIILGRIYYVSPIAGSNDGLGNINLLDPCLSVSQGVPVIFYRPEVSVSGGGNICPTECVTYTIAFSGEKPFELLYQINADGVLMDRTLTTDQGQVELAICPADYGLTDGILDIIPMSMSDANCTVSLSPVPGSHATVHPVSTAFISDFLCPGQTFVLNGTVYDQDHPSGIQTLQTAEGCDSIIEINLSFYEPAQYEIQQTLCLGGSMMVNGTEYNESHPAGTEVILGGSINGCDSSITVQLDFNSVVFSNLNSTLCPGESIFINGSTYDEFNPTGTEIFPGGSALGCDSVVNIQLSFSPIAESEINQTLCKGEWIEVNGSVYDETNNSGVEVLPNASVFGCDSVVSIQLSYFPSAESSITQKLCKGEWITVNGTVYDENHASGFEVLPNESIYGCDSVVNILLSFLPPAESEFLQTLCKGEWIEVNGTVYDETHPSGVAVMPNASVLGCDSTILVDLSFYPEAFGYVMDTLDVGKSIVINGTEYDQSNPTGIEVIPGGSVMGCDSIITIALYFHHALSAIVQTTAPVCHGEFTGEIIVEDIVGGLPPYLIFIDGGSQWTVDVLPAVLPGLSAGTYKLIIIDGLSATIDFDLVVSETPELKIDAGIDLQIEKGKDVPLNAKASFPVANWLWSPVDFLSCTDCPDPVAVGPDRDIVYSVIATDEEGCQASDDIQLIILPDDELYVPTVFSPNGDGVNDTWRIYSSDQETQLISLSILDRWGSIIFNCSDRLLIDSGVEWDGYMKGGEMGTGVYVFVAVVKTGDQASKHIKGDFTLIR